MPEQEVSARRSREEERRRRRSGSRAGGGAQAGVRSARPHRRLPVPAVRSLRSGGCGPPSGAVSPPARPMASPEDPLRAGKAVPRRALTWGVGARVSRDPRGAPGPGPRGADRGPGHEVPRPPPLPPSLTRAPDAPSAPSAPHLPSALFALLRQVGTSPPTSGGEEGGFPCASASPFLPRSGLLASPLLTSLVLNGFVLNMGPRAIAYTPASPNPEPDPSGGTLWRGGISH